MGNLRQVMRDILETTKAELFTMDMFPPQGVSPHYSDTIKVDMGGERFPREK